MDALKNIVLIAGISLSFSIAHATNVELKEMNSKETTVAQSEDYKQAAKVCGEKHKEDKAKVEKCISDEIAANKEVCQGTECVEKDESDPAIVGEIKKGPTGVQSFRKITKKATATSGTNSNGDSFSNESSEEDSYAEMEVFDYGAAAMEMVESTSPMVAGTSVSPKESEMAFVPAGGDQNGVNLKPAKGKSKVGDVVIAGLKKSNPKAMAAIEGLYKDRDVHAPAMSQADFDTAFQESAGRAPTRQEKETHAAYANARNTAEQAQPNRQIASVNKRDMTTTGLFDSSSPDAEVFTPDGEKERGNYRTYRRGQGDQWSRKNDR